MEYHMLQVIKESSFATYEAHKVVNMPIAGQLLVKVTDEGRLADHFRVAVFGNSPVKAMFAIDSLVDTPGAASWTFELERRPTEIRPRDNSFTTRWIDRWWLPTSSR